MVETPRGVKFVGQAHSTHQGHFTVLWVKPLPEFLTWDLYAPEYRSSNYIYLGDNGTAWVKHDTITPTGYRDLDTAVMALRMRGDSG